MAELDDAALQFASALARYEASSARLPGGRYAPRANNRAYELRTHSEGGFAPLVRLETVRRSPDLANDPGAVYGLARDAASFPPGKVRVEARMLAVEAYLGRLHRTADAVPLLRLVVDDPHADVLTARAAADDLVTVHIQANRLAGALAVARAYPRLLAPTTERDILRLMRRRPLRVIAWGDLAALAAFALLALAGPGRGAVRLAVRRVAPLALAFSAFACGVGGLLASSYEQTSPLPVHGHAPAVFGTILLARAWSAGGSTAPPARALRAIVSFAGVFAAAFLMLDRMDPAYLQGFGL